MDFVVGRIPPPGAPSERSQARQGQVEARVLHVRPPRGRRREEPDPRSGSREERRSGSASVDPPGARVLVLLVPDAHRLPDELMNGDYRVFLRFAKKGT
jgi:hypothetical protein